jgi:hypothetical protein
LVADVIDTGFAEGVEEFLAFEFFADEEESEVECGWEFGAWKFWMHKTAFSGVV